MLLQSRIRYQAGGFLVVLDILPALPQSWPSGRVTGARAKGNLELDLEWQEGRIISLIIRNRGTAAVPVLLRGAGLEEREMVLKPGETVIPIDRYI